MSMVALSKVNKTTLANQLKISRTSLYYTKVQPAKDEALKNQIETVMVKHKAYGHKRIALELQTSKKRIRRVMKMFGLKPVRLRKWQPVKLDDQNKLPVDRPNVTKILCPIAPNIVWAGDFTYISYHGKFIYLATILDRFTREVVGFAVSCWHNKELVLQAFKTALEHTKKAPVYFHSDQGSEYDSQEYISYLESLNVVVSMSDKAAPWQNGPKESFYSHYKFELDLKNANRFNSLGELLEAIYIQIYYYNTERIHTALKMSPRTFRRLYESQRLTNQTPVD